MEYIQVESSNISEIGYDHNSNMLAIRFNSGAEYEYYDVPNTVYEELMSSESKGKYANQHIYREYRQKKIGT